MSLVDLPNELLDDIVVHTIPEEFESLALTCRRLYELCLPHAKEYNRLHSKFRKIKYDQSPMQPQAFKTATDLIGELAAEPIAKGFIRDATLFDDSVFPQFLSRGERSQYFQNAEKDVAIVKMLARCPFLKQAGLDWREYYAELKREISSFRYSQLAAAFLLTLLPNVKILRLPTNWTSLEATNRLINVIIHNANQSHLFYERRSLGQVAKLHLQSDYGMSVNTACVTTFLALPHLTYFNGGGFENRCQGQSRNTTITSYPSFGGELHTIHLQYWCNAAEIGSLLRRAPGVREFRYLHAGGLGTIPRWDICEFCAAVEHAVGSHLLMLSLTTMDLDEWVTTPTKFSLRGFKHLKTLVISLDLIPGLIAAAGRYPYMPPGYWLMFQKNQQSSATSDSFSICDIVPASVSDLSLIMFEVDLHASALEILFRDFTSERASKLPALRTVSIACSWQANWSYLDQYFKLFEQTWQVGVSLQYLQD